MFMKSKTFVIAFELLAFLFFSMVALPSCSKDDDENPAYVGTWAVDAAGGVFAPKFKAATVVAMDYREVMELSKDAFTITSETGSSDINSWTPVLGVKGSLSVAGDVLTMTDKKYGIANTNLVLTYTDIPAEEQTVSKIKWSVAGNKLTIISDDNGDNDFNDVEDGDDTLIIYTKI